MTEPTKFPADKPPVATQLPADKPIRVSEKPVEKPALEFRRKRLEEAQKVIEEAKEILAEYDGLEADIPVSHNYWGLMNDFRYLSKV